MNTRPHTASIVAAFASVYIIWGTTYVAIAIAIRTAPPFVAGALRFMLAGLLLYTWLRLRDQRPFAGLRIGPTVLCGVLLTGVGNGFVLWAQQGVPSGMAALIAGSVPVLVQLLDWLFFSKRAPSSLSLAGICLALVGVGLVVSHTHTLTGDIRPLYVAALLVAVCAWSLATLLQRKAVPPGKVLNFTALQMFAGGIFQAVMGFVDGEWRVFHVSEVSLPSWLAILYLTIPGSLIAFTSYLWLLTRVSAQKATTYALVNPVVALVLGAIILGERITQLSVAAAVLVLTGVGMVLLQPAPRVSRCQKTDGATSQA